MTDRCLVHRCQEPRPHGFPCCDIHMSLVDKNTKGRFQYALSLMVKCPDTSGPRLERYATRLKEARAEVMQAIQNALKEREAL